MIKDDNYVVIQGFMVKELGLKPTEQIIYALIYNFNQSTGKPFVGSISYLQEWTNVTKPSVINCINSLIEKQLIVKKNVVINGVKRNEYYINQDNIGGSKKSLPPLVKKFDYPSKKSLPPLVKNFYHPSKKILPNIYNNNINNKYNNKYNNKDYSNISNEYSTNYIISKIPDWFDENIKKEEYKENEKNEIEELLKDFKKD